MLKLLHYRKCSTCKKAIQFIKKELIRADYIDIVENPLGIDTIRSIYEHCGRSIKELLNTSGKTYHSLPNKDELQAMPIEHLFEFLSANGKLIKRPILLGNSGCCIGFNEKEWLALAIQDEMNSI